jgi:hypothetical protein
MMLDHQLSRDQDHRVLEENACQVIILTYFIVIIKQWKKYDHGGGARTSLIWRSLLTIPRRLGS